MDQVEMRRRNGAHRPPARPMSGGVAPSSGPPPLKVYCVEPRDFRELVQRLTGVRTAAPPPEPAPPVGTGQRMTLTPAAVPQSNGEAAAAAGQFDYSPWFSAPLLSPAYAPAGFDGHHGNQGRF